MSAEGSLQATEKSRDETAELEQLRIVFDRARDAMIVFNGDLRVTDVNQAACRLFECAKEELLSLHVRDFLEMMSSEALERYDYSLTSGDHFYFEGPLYLPNGSIKYIEFQSEKHDGKNAILMTTFRDITKTKNLENERFISQEMFQDIFNQAIDGILIFDKKGRIIDANPSLCRRIGYTKNELLVQTLSELVLPIYHYKIERLWHALKRNGKSQGELPIQTRQGEEVYFDFTTTAHINSDYYMSIMRDVTEKRDMEQELAKSEKKFREIFESAVDAIIIWNEDWTVVDANPSSSRTFELPLHQLIGSNLEEFLDLSQPKTKEITNRFYDFNAIREELPFYMPNGEKKDLEFTAKQGIIKGHNLTIFRNISERKKMEQELRESEQKFRTIFNGSVDGVLLWNENLKIIDANSVLCDFVELTKEEVCSLNVRNLLDEGNKKILDAHLSFLKEYREHEGELTYTMKSGRKRTIEYSTKKDIIPGVYMTMLRDVTEKKEMEEQIRKSDTLQVVGQLAAGIAHEIRNPMTALKGFIQLLQNSIDHEEKDDFSLYFDVITSELQRIENIITDFLVLAKPQAIKHEQKDIIQIVQETMDLLTAQATLVNVQFHTEFDPSLPLLYCEPNQLKQVFINIMKNALEVMPIGGTLTVSVHAKDEKFIVVSIRDEGEGMPEERIKRLGEPFYTTKEKGTGLGLMVSYKIIEEHGGYIDVHSEIGRGTTFSIILPINPSEENKKE
ncbi:PAS domain S-box protein [Priestia endophytica]|uniref:PAS domain S-box protein n=1 Tax=Priestia endophytica TaxID=135735 RepID=UPI003D29B92B